MKPLFDRTGSVLAGLDRRQKKQALAVTLAVAGCFVLSAFTFLNALYCLSECISSILSGSPEEALQGALRSAPIFLSFFLTLSGLMIAHSFYRNESPELLQKRAKKHAVITVALGAGTVACVPALRLTGKVLSLTEGGPSRLYPLDALLYALLSLACGAAVLAYLHKGAGFTGPCRAPVQRKCRTLRCFFRGLWLLMGLYGFCGFFFGLFIMDFSIGYVPYTLAFLLVSLVDFLSIAGWELWYNSLTETRRRAVLLPLALVSLGVSLAAATLYFLALHHHLEGPANVGFGVLPVAMSSGVNLATLLVVATPVIVSVSALVKALYRKGKAAPASPKP